MFHTSLRTKVVGMVLGCFLASGIFLLVFLHITFLHELDSISEQAVRSSQKTFQNLEDADINKLAAVLDSILANPEFDTTYKAEDRDPLYSRTKPYFDRMTKLYHFTQWLYYTADGKYFLRLHNPGRFGDPANRWMYDECVRTKAVVSGTELGYAGFSLRVMMPRLDRHGEFKGCLELGEEIGTFFRVMKSQTGNEFALALKKSLMDEEKWAVFTKLRGLPNNWNAQENIVVANRTTPDEKLLHIPLNVDDIPSQGKVLPTARENGSVYARGAFPIYSANGQRVGVVFVVRDITAAVNNVQHAQMVVFVAIVVVTVLTSILANFALKRYLFQRFEGMMEGATAVLGGDFGVVGRITHDDELGRFERQFLQLLVNLMKR